MNLRGITISLSLAASAAFGLSSVATVSADLNIGDLAPPLSITEWVKGESIDLERDAAKKFHMVEFWAVWCPPCKMSVPLLTELQKKYSKDLVIVGITEPDAGRNSPAAIRRFVKQQGPNMGYTVATDKEGKTTKGYLGTGTIGIPHAFLVGKDRRIVWQGSPLDPAMGDVLAQLVAGEYDVDAAKVEQEVFKRLEELDFLARLGQWQRVWDGLVGILKLDPGSQVAMDALTSISSQELHNTEAFREWTHGHITAHGDNGTAMQRLAKTLCGIDNLSRRFPDLALDAARAAYKAKDRKEASAIAIYARALYQIGELDRAIALQQDAVALAQSSEREGIKGTLEYYRNCKKLQGKLD